MQKTVFISGASSGIGLVTAKKLAETGWRVYAAALPSDDFSVLPKAIIPIPLDIRDIEAVKAVATEIESEAGSLEGLVNNAGIQIASPLEAIGLDEMRRQFEVNVFGHLGVIQTMLPLLRKAETARIVNVSSLMGKVAMPALGAYSMSKHALEAMSDTLRMELKVFGIDVSLVEMGAIATPMTHAVAESLEANQAKTAPILQNLYAHLFQGMAKALRKQNKMASSPDKIAQAILHALSSKKPKTRYIIGGDTLGLFMMRKFAPDEIGDSILMRALGLE